MAKKKYSPQDVAEALGVSAQTVRVALQKGMFPFGWAIKTSVHRYTYAISPKLFEEYLGQSTESTSEKTKAILSQE